MFSTLEVSQGDFWKENIPKPNELEKGWISHETDQKKVNFFGDSIQVTKLSPMFGGHQKTLEKRVTFSRHPQQRLRIESPGSLLFHIFSYHCAAICFLPKSK